MNAAAEWQYMNTAYEQMLEYGYGERDRHRDIAHCARLKGTIHTCFSTRHALPINGERWHWKRDAIRRAREEYLQAAYRVVWYDMLHG